MKTLKIAVIGCGSIGKRHLLNVADVLSHKKIHHAIDLIRRNPDIAVEKEIKDIVRREYSIDEEIPDDYDIMFITNPTFLHYDTIKRFVSHTKHMFVEKPVFSDLSCSVEELKLKEKCIYYVACPLRYTNVIQYLKKTLDVNRVFSVRVICSSYLPDWRPQTDYRDSYSAHSDQGGGVSIDLIHEWDYIQYLFGQPEYVNNIRGKFSKLEIDSDDLSIYIAKYEKMMVEVHLDYFGRKTIREIQIFTDEDTIVGDIVSGEIRYLKSGEVVMLEESRNDFYRKEIVSFFEMIEGNAPNHNDLCAAMKTLAIAKEGRII